MPCMRADQAATALAVVWARQEINDCEISVTSSEDVQLFPMGAGFAYNCWLGSCSSLIIPRA